MDWGDTVMRVFPDSPGPMHTWSRVEAVDGVRDALAAIRKHYDMALATNAVDSTRDEIRLALKRGGLGGFFDRVFCYRDVGYRKPSAEFFTHVIGSLERPAGSIMMVGDDLDGDVRGAVAAGMWGMWYNPRSREVSNGPRFATFHDFRALEQALVDLWGASTGTREGTATGDPARGRA